MSSIEAQSAMCSWDSALSTLHLMMSVHDCFMAMYAVGLPHSTGASLNQLQ